MAKKPFDKAFEQELKSSILTNISLGFFDSNFFLTLQTQNILTFKQIVDLLKKTRDFDSFNDPCLWVMLNEEEFFKSAFSNNFISHDDLRYLWKKITRNFETFNLCKNLYLISYLFDNAVFNEYDLANKAHATDDLHQFFSNHVLFKFFESRNLLTSKYAQFILRKKFNSTVEDLTGLSMNLFLIESLFCDYKASSKFLARVDNLLENHPWAKRFNITSFYEIIDHTLCSYSEPAVKQFSIPQSNRERIQHLATIHKATSTLNFTSTEKQQILDLTFNNEIQQNKYLHLIHTQALNAIQDYKTLEQYLTKHERKSLLNI